MGSNSSMLESTWGGACVGQHGWNTDFAHRMYQCGIASGGQQPAAGSCMARKQQVSGSCGVCLGNLIHCGMGCISECCLGNCPYSSQCRSCNARKCNPAFSQCAGVDPARRLDAGDIVVSNTEDVAEHSAPSHGINESAMSTLATPSSLVPEATSNSSMLGSTWGGACVGQHGWNTDFAHRMYQCGIFS